MSHAPTTAPTRVLTADEAVIEHEIAALLELARLHLDMDVVFLGRFDDTDRTIEVAAAADPATAASLTGTSTPREETYCQLIAAGELDHVTRDTSTVQRLARLDVTRELRIGSYLGVPVVEADGSVWGTVCSYTHEPAPHLIESDAGALRFIADLISTRVAAITDAGSERGRAAATIDELLAEGDLAMVGQPIVALDDGTVVGTEALARFPNAPPTEVFALAALGERSTELELAAIRSAATAIPLLPGDRWLSCNVSLRTASDPRFDAMIAALERAVTNRLVLEVTEQERLADERTAGATLEVPRRLGARIAMDDIGAGWSGLERALRIEPEILKLDRALITAVHADRHKQALVTAICAFADAVGATVVAEGIEVPDERSALRDLGVPLGQGWLLGRPTPLPVPGLTP